MVTFTQRHFEALAKILGDSCIEEDSQLMENMIDYFEKDNPRFRTKRFKDAVKRHCLIKMGM